MTEQTNAAEQVQAQLDKGWESVSIEQLGPDGTETLALLIFLVCPVCRAVVPLPVDERDFTKEHGQWHLEQAARGD